METLPSRIVDLVLANARMPLWATLIWRSILECRCRKKRSHENNVYRRHYFTPKLYRHRYTSHATCAGR